jgi:hypothetical protein
MHIQKYRIVRPKVGKVCPPVTPTLLKTFKCDSCKPFDELKVTITIPTSAVSESDDNWFCSVGLKSAACV